MKDNEMLFSSSTFSDSNPTSISDCKICMGCASAIAPVIDWDNDLFEHTIMQI
ncbi:MAG: hypothetical protein ACJ71I_16825 [Nitrososphaeraceae archaeon]